MKALFLDFDGVLSGSTFRHSLPRTITLSARPDIDPACAARVQRICDATGASLVVTSDWRISTSSLRRPLGEVALWLREAGITAPVKGRTDWEIMGMSSGPSIDRMHQILRFIDRHDVSRWIAIDDMDLHLDEQVQTDERTGITDADVERAILMLGEVRS